MKISPQNQPSSSWYWMNHSLFYLWWLSLWNVITTTWTNFQTTPLLAISFVFFFRHVNFVIVHSKCEDMHRILSFFLTSSGQYPSETYQNVIMSIYMMFWCPSRPAQIWNSRQLKEPLHQMLLVSSLLCSLWRERSKTGKRVLRCVIVPFTI